jgi:NAD(P)-dependent dehydrogenase (short-subunit alcohol dehydrogenase family)
MEEEHCPSSGGSLKWREMSRMSETLLPYSHLVITGGSSGIGKCFISTITNHNKEIRICNLSRTAAEGFSEASARRQVPCDLGGPDDRKAAIASVESWLGEADDFCRACASTVARW